MKFGYANQRPERQNPVLDELQRLAQAVRAGRGNEPRHYDPLFEDDLVAEEQRSLAQSEAADICSAVMEMASRPSENIMDFIQQEIAGTDQSRYWAADRSLDNDRVNTESPFEPMAADSMDSALHPAMGLENIVDKEFQHMEMNGPMLDPPMEDQAMQDMQGMGMPPQM